MIRRLFRALWLRVFPHPAPSTGDTWLQPTLHVVPSPEDECDHDIQPTPGEPDWGTCTRCRQGGFPLTPAAAYGDVECSTCSDTGLVPVNVDGTMGTRKDGTTYIRQGSFADGPCPDCQVDTAAGGKAR